jgi:hypothetical protein
VLDNTDQVQASVTFRPSGNLKIDNTYLLNRLIDRPTGMSAFTNHIIRSEWNYQITRELSLRLIPQYTVVLANPHFTSQHRDLCRLQQRPAKPGLAVGIRSQQQPAAHAQPLHERWAAVLREGFLPVQVLRTTSPQRIADL